ncbi:MAG: hypothetical protein V1743_07870 [Nanoarchaeota archaeon]
MAFILDNMNKTQSKKGMRVQKPSYAYLEKLFKRAHAIKPKQNLTAAQMDEMIERELSEEKIL